jgi:hypothetical protein
MEGTGGFNLFGDPDELRARLEELAEQAQDSQRVAWADNAIRLAVEMTVAAINGLELSGSSDEQAAQVRDAIRIVFPEAVTLVREAREGLA